jgi:hypothetical protein
MDGMRLVQFEVPSLGRRVGLVEGDGVLDVTSVRSEWTRMTEIFATAERTQASFDDLLSDVARESGIATLDYAELLDASPGDGRPFLHSPLDAADPHRVLITGTGLTHLGSMQIRDDMHSAKAVVEPAAMTDSARMFRMGIAGGKPPAGQRGVAPEWFYKGNGFNLRGHRWTLAVPEFALDGGEEAELVGCYVIDSRGNPRRLGFALGNEWSDHATERINYLYLAPSKLRQCAVGPELITDFDFQELKLACRVVRRGETIYDSGELHTGEKHMCHSLANCEDHHFKYPQHRIPGDVHLHFFGTSKLSYGTRQWKYETGDEIQIVPESGAALVNPVQRADESGASTLTARGV